jgi:excisionase family DNA binding protein
VLGGIVKLLTKRETAAQLGLSLRSIDHLIAEGKLRVVRPGGLDAVRIEASEVERLIAASREGDSAA